MMVMGRIAILSAIAAVLVATWWLWTPPRPPLEDVVRNKNFLVTGGGTGIGAELAKAICSLGGRVYITGRTEATLNKSCAAAAVASGRSGCCVWGVHDAAETLDCVSAVRSAQQAFGGALHHLILNHAFGRVTKLLEMSLEELLPAFRRTFDANVYGSICLVHQAAPILQDVARKQKEDAIKPTVLVVGSISHSYGIPRLGLYSSSKAAMVPLLNVWRREMPDLGFVYAAVGFVKTDLSVFMPEEAIRTAMPADICAIQLLEALASQQREVYMPAQWDPYVPGALAHLAFLIAPGWVEEAAATQYGSADFVKAYNPKHPLDERK